MGKNGLSNLKNCQNLKLEYGKIIQMKQDDRENSVRNKGKEYS